MKDKVLIYGAYGYTGTLIVEEAIQNQLPIIIAGRNSTKLASLANTYNLQFRRFDLIDPHEIANNLGDVHTVIHCAGPFQHTAQPMVNACLLSQTHYIDITGEIDVFEWIASKNEEAIRKNVMLLPGAGFDVVPSDCLALFLKKQLPDATHLTLAFYSTGKPSHGTMLTALESMGKGGKIRMDGKIETVPPAYKRMKIDFGEGPKLAVTIPWGDVSTAYYTTKIPNIEVYMAVTPGMNLLLQGIKLTQRWVGTEPIQQFLKHRIPEGGPSKEERINNYTLLWGQVRNENNITKQARLKTPDGYDLTAKSSVYIAKQILQGQYTPGFQTPASAYTENLILNILNTNYILD